MLRYIYGHDLHRNPKLHDSMFRDRAEQFSRRLRWEVSVNADGLEKDQYDALNPLYVIWEMSDGTHGGSMRLLPTTGRTMVHEHFSHLTDGVRIESPLIWECTRFCLSPNAPRMASAALVLGAGEVMTNFHLSHFVGVFDKRMERIYRMHGVQPDVIGTAGEGNQQIGVGLWEMKPDAWPTTLKRVAITRETSTAWFKRSMSQSRESHVFQPAYA